MNFSLQEISSITGGRLVANAEIKSCTQIYIDTRTIGKVVHDGVFFAIKSRNQDGHSFIPEAFHKGIRNFVIEDESLLNVLKEEIFCQSNFLVVKNSINSLQVLAAKHREKFKCPVIGITGSNGKTIVKEWLYQLMYSDKSIYRSPKSYNSQIGVPLSVLGLADNYNLGIFEAGISAKREMENLEKIIKPDTGIFTNIGSAHQENFSTVKEKIAEKLILFKNSELLIYRKDYQELSGEIENKLKQGFFRKSIKLISWSTSCGADFNITSVTKSRYDTVIKGIFDKKVYSLKIGFSDEASIENAIHCWLYLILNNYTAAEINEKMLHLSPVEMRLELKEAVNNCTLINDSYNSDINSLGIALDFLGQQNQHQRKTLILSDIFQSGLGEKNLYKQVSDLLKSKGTNRLIGIGPVISRNAGLFGADSSFYLSTDEFLKEFSNIKFGNEAILVKGARVFEFEKISSLLQKKIHATTLELNLHSLVNNLNVYRSLLKPDTKIMAMVKAFSYGSGSHEIANVLQFQNVDYLAVAYTDEGVDLRKKGITLPVMVMNPDRDSLPVIFNNDLEPEIYSINLLHELAVFSKTGTSLKILPVHIKVDSGMHRLGFSAGEIKELLKVLDSHPNIIVRSVFSHLAASENSEDDKFTAGQIELFGKLAKEITDNLEYPVIRHLLNSSGAVRFPEAQFDMVRLGLGLYGIDSSGLIQDKLENISTFKTTISQIRDVKKGESIGYGTRAIMNKDSKIAVIGVGYADGLSRSLGNGRGTVLVNGREAIITGNVCMDMSLIDITGIDASEGNEVIIFGKELPVSLMAKKLNTIPYEILTSVSQRVKRIYFKE